MPELTTEQLTLALGIVAVAALLALLTTLLLALRLKKIHRQLVVVRGEASESDILSVIRRALGDIKEVDKRVDAVAAAAAQESDLRKLALQRFGLVRYDAFEEMGGQLSFSAAVLDERGDGLVITSINGRTETRTYAKPIRGLDSTHNLSQEEREAISIATSGREISRQHLAASH